MDAKADDLLEEISRLEEATRAGSVEWAKANPSTFVLEPLAANARVSIQRVMRNPLARKMSALSGLSMTEAAADAYGEPAYIFQVVETPFDRVRLAVDTGEDRRYHAILSQLFATVSDNVTAKGLALAGTR